MAEGAPLLRVYRLIPYRGFESLALRHLYRKGHPRRGALFGLGGEGRGLGSNPPVRQIRLRGEFDSESRTTRSKAKAPAGAQQAKACCDQSLTWDLETKPILRLPKYRIQPMKQRIPIIRRRSSGDHRESQLPAMHGLYKRSVI